MNKNLPIWVRTIAATLLFAMFYYFAGYRLVYFVIMHSAKSEAAMAIRFDKASLQNLSLSATEYSKVKWTESDKEFVFNGQLYDVVSTEKADGKFNLQVYADKNETRWARALNDFVKQFFPTNDNDGGKGMKTAEAMVSAFQKEYTPLTTLKVRLPEKLRVNYFVAAQDIPYSALSSDIWHPPTC